MQDPNVTGLLSWLPARTASKRICVGSFYTPNLLGSWGPLAGERNLNWA